MVGEGAETQVFPVMHLFPRLEVLGARVTAIWNLGRVTEPCLSNHVNREPEDPQLRLEV